MQCQCKYNHGGPKIAYEILCIILLIWNRPCKYLHTKAALGWSSVGYGINHNYGSILLAGPCRVVSGCCGNDSTNNVVTLLKFGNNFVIDNG